MQPKLKIEKVKASEHPLRRLKGRYYVVLVAENGKTLSTSETFPQLASAINNAEAQQDDAPQAVIVLPDGEIIE